MTVLHGKPDAAELAAVTAVLLARLRMQACAEDAAAPASGVAPRAEWSVRGEGRTWAAPAPRGRR